MSKNVLKITKKRYKRTKTW